MVPSFLPKAHWVIFIVKPPSDSVQSSNVFPGQPGCAVGDQKHNYAHGVLSKPLHSEPGCREIRSAKQIA